MKFVFKEINGDLEFTVCAVTATELIGQRISAATGLELKEAILDDGNRCWVSWQARRSMMYFCSAGGSTLLSVPIKWTGDNSFGYG